MRTNLKDVNPQLNGFAELITKESDPEHVRKALTSLYMNYSRMLIKFSEEFPVSDADDELCTLGMLIDVLDGSYPAKSS